MGYDRKLILTGKTGYLGTEIFNYFSKKKIKVRTIGRKNSDIIANLANKKKIKNKLIFKKNEILIHTAGFVPKTIEDYNNKKKNKQNIIILKNILQTNVKYIIFISSFAVYGSQNKITNKRLNINKHLNEYAKSKIICEKLLLKSKKKIIIIRIPGIFGGNRKNGLIYNCIKNLILRKKNKFYDLYLWTGIHIKDIILGLNKLIKYKFKNKIINFAYKNPLSSQEVIEYLYKINKRKIKFKDKNKFKYYKTQQKILLGSFKKRLKEEFIKLNDQKF